MHPRKEKTFVVIKHDGVQRSLVGEVIKRIERAGLKIVGMKMLVASENQAREHYGKDDLWCEKVGNGIIENLKKTGRTPEKEALAYGREILNGLVHYLTVGPIITLVIEGNQAVGIVKKLVGGTEPLTSDVGTIRGDFTIDSYATANVDGRAVRNIIHCTDKPEEAEREISIWFKSEELVNYRLIEEEILYDVNLDGILE